MLTITVRPRPVSDAEDAQHGLHLHVVEVRRRLVGDDERRVQRQRASDGDALHLPAAQRARAVIGAIREADVVRGVRRRVWRLRRVPTPAARNGTITFSVAVRLGTRLNAWNTTPTLLRR